MPDPVTPATPSHTTPSKLHISVLIAEPPRASEIAALHAQTFSDAWSGQTIEGLLGDPGAIAFIAKVAGETGLPGFTIARLVGDEAEIITIGVAPQHHRQGIGSKLVNGLIRALERAEAKRLFLEVAVDNESARALYDRAGFLAVGLRRGYYQRPGQPPVDGLTLSRSI